MLGAALQARRAPIHCQPFTPPRQQGARLTSQLPFRLSLTSIFSLLRRSATLRIHKDNFLYVGPNDSVNQSKLPDEPPTPQHSRIFLTKRLHLPVRPHIFASESSIRKVCCRRGPPRPCITEAATHGHPIERCSQLRTRPSQKGSCLAVTL